MKLSHIVTKKGDLGTTSWNDDHHILKCDDMIAVIGTLDEANAHIGLALQIVPTTIQAHLQMIQNDLFDLGNDLYTLKSSITEAHVNKLESLILGWNAHLPPLTSFVLPGGGEISARLHVARTVVRRAERYIVAVHTKTPVNPFILKYMNRLSDLLFVLSRYLQTDEEALWIPSTGPLS